MELLKIDNDQIERIEERAKFWKCSFNEALRVVIERGMDD